MTLGGAHAPLQVTLAADGTGATDSGPLEGNLSPAGLEEPDYALRVGERTPGSLDAQPKTSGSYDPRSM